MPSTAVLSQKKTLKASSVPGTSGNVVPTDRNVDMLVYGTVKCH